MALTKTPIINTQLDTMNHLLGSLVRQKMSEATELDLEEVAKNVRRGLASEMFDIGDQIIVPWKDTFNDTEYQMPFDIVHFGTAILEDGEEVPAMYLQSHYCLPTGLQFDGQEAFYTQDTELAAGTYYVTIGSALGDFFKVDMVIQFTLTQAVPANGQLVFSAGVASASGIAKVKVLSYESASATEPIETVQCSLGSEGTSLGTLSSTVVYGTTGPNNLQRCAYGYNRWSQSAARQYLNSKADKGAWWTPQNPYDRASNELATSKGFMAGFADDFLSILKPVKITTALNAVSDGEIGTTEDTFDTFFLPSKRNENLIEQLSGVEGDIWDYWYRVTKGIKPKDRVDGAAPVTYSLAAHETPQTVRLRSATRSSAGTVWFVNSSGNVYCYNSATTAHRFAPACVIC